MPSLLAEGKGSVISESYFIVGLGNPGEEYADTRHNAGFRTVDLIGERVGVRYWKRECGALTGTGAYRAVDVVLAKPQSYMNTSGGPVKQVCAAYGIAPDHLVVIHDELDIPAGSVRVKFGGGHAGHNGLRSICDKLGTRDWYRVRCGIGRPPGRMGAADFVLAPLRKDAADTFAQTVETAADAALSLIVQGLARTQQEFN